MTAFAPRIAIQAEPFDQAAEVKRLSAGRTDLGAVVTFLGVVRDEGGRLAALELEHYPAMAEAEAGRIAAEAMKRWPLQGLTIVHRAGRLVPGDGIVLVAAAAVHRTDAFRAAEFVIDHLKVGAPFWKKEHPADGSKAAWVEAKASDAEALKRWAPVPPGRRG